MTTAVDRLYEEFQAIQSVLDNGHEISLRSSVDGNYRKSLLLSAASYFESRLCEDLHGYFVELCGVGPASEFVKNKAIKRQYHTFFKWDASNANQFFGLFGVDFKERMVREVESNETFRASVRAFLEVGSDRNRLVHQDFATVALEKTATEIFDLYKRALLFVNLLPKLLREAVCNSSVSSAGDQSAHADALGSDEGLLRPEVVQAPSDRSESAISGCEGADEVEAHAADATSEQADNDGKNGGDPTSSFGEGVRV